MQRDFTKKKILIIEEIYPVWSDLMRGKIALFTIDMLINMLMKAGLAVDIHISGKKAA